MLSGVVSITKSTNNPGGLEGDGLRGLTVAFGGWCIGYPRKSLILQGFSPFRDNLTTNPEIDHRLPVARSASMGMEPGARCVRTLARGASWLRDRAGLATRAGGVSARRGWQPAQGSPPGDP